MNEMFCGNYCWQWFSSSFAPAYSVKRRPCLVVNAYLPLVGSTGRRLRRPPFGSFFQRGSVNCARHSTDECSSRKKTTRRKLLSGNPWQYVLTGVRDVLTIVIIVIDTIDRQFTATGQARDPPITSRDYTVSISVQCTLT